jgi:hypothetical protein
MLEQIGNRSLLAITKFTHEFAPGPEHSASFSGDLMIKQQPIRASVQSASRVVISHFRLKMLNLTGGNVRRIGYDQIETDVCWQRRKAIPGEEVDTIEHCMMQSISARYYQSFRADIQGHNARTWAVHGQCDRQAPASCAKVQRRA